MRYQSLSTVTKEHILPDSSFVEGVFGWKWKMVYLKVFKDSEVAWFNEKGERKGEVVLKVLDRSAALTSKLLLSEPG